MKKAQVLSALALAFALGVVAPVASTHAAMVKIDDKGALVTDKDMTKKMNDAIEDGKESCGWHLRGAGADAVMAYYYDQFIALDDALTVADNVIKAEKEFLYDTATGTNGVGVGSAFLANYPAGLKGYYAAVITQLNGTITTPSDDIETSFPDTVKTYDQAVTFINNARVEMTKLANRYNNENKAADSAAYRLAATQLEGAIDSAADDLEYVEEVQSDSTIQPAILRITTDKLDTAIGAEVNTDMTYAQAVSTAKALTANNHGTCNITKALNIQKAVEYAESLIASTNSFWASEGEKAIANIKKAMNGGTVTDDDVNNGGGTNKPGDDNKDPNAPDTGILADGEANASTTVAMVAGIATALTAAGAGVVAYRNARRSTRK